MSKSVRTVPPAEVTKMMGGGDAVLIDVRGDMEHAREHIAGCKHLPLDRFSPEAAQAEIGEAKRVVFYCQSGMRTGSAAGRFADLPCEEIYILEGGLSAWKDAGLPTQVNRKVPIDLMRQVQIGAGSLVLLGVLLGLFVHPGFYGLSAFVGAGLLVAGLTGFCGMARILALMPWNQLKEA